MIGLFSCIAIMSVVLSLSVDTGYLYILVVTSSASIKKGHRRIAGLYGSSDYIFKRINTISAGAIHVFTPFNTVLRFSFLFVLIDSGHLCSGYPNR